MSKTHHYEVSVTWTGNTGAGTSSYRAFERAHEVEVEGKPLIPGSSDPAFRGDPARWNPEELLVASLSQCHMLWFLHLCAMEKVVVTSYVDKPYGTMAETPDGGGRFEEVVLRPRVGLADSEKADQVGRLHGRAHELCFIANSVNFPVRHEPVVE
ncbi:OsmC family peroxiredoxin [Actinomadura sp. NEAU-AAG5]|uniref:OsmC family peroxiredoxin n=1 Tax=Actinomadura litoris TaxID=2678616 RepID=A0A7K1KUR5_9ACTN|nr:OsmC family peroxiredoxin [Actinomadura litoris]